MANFAGDNYCEEYKVMDDFNFDLERMKKAVESERIPIPPEALESDEAFNNWLNDEKNNNDSTYG